MAKLIMFLTLLIGFMLVLTFTTYKTQPISHEKFNLAQMEKVHKEKLVLLAGEEEGEEVTASQSTSAAAAIILDTPELENGYKVYMSLGQCATCHGKNGEGKKSQEAPKLAGQYDWYLYEQLVNMKNKVRVNKKMDIYLKKLSDQDLSDVSLYLSKLPIRP